MFDQQRIQRGVCYPHTLWGYSTRTFNQMHVVSMPGVKDETGTFEPVLTLLGASLYQRQRECRR